MATQSNLRDLRGVPFAQVETKLLRDPSISPQCKALYSLLITYGPTAIFPGQEKLAKALGVSRQTIKNWLNALRDFGLIGWDRRGSMSNLYYIYGYANMGNVKLALQKTESPIDNKCKAQLTRSISTELDPLKNKESPIGECSPEPFPTDSNLSPGDDPPEQPSILEQTDPLSMAAEVFRRGGDRRSWTVTGPEGANPWEDGPVTAYCKLTHMPNAPPGAIENWARKFEKIAAKWQASPAQFVMAVGLISKDKKHDWRSFTSPFNPSFEGVMDVMLSRVKSGQTTQLVIRND